MILGNIRTIKSAKIKQMNTFPTSPKPSDMINVLIVEDNVEHANIFGLYLERSKTYNFSVKISRNLSSATEEISQTKYDVILLDLTLPESQGLDTFYQLQACCGSTPIVVLSGMDDEGVAVEAVRGGAQDYLVKGHADQQLIVRSIRYALERKKSEEFLRHSEERFRLLIENSSDLIGLIDNELRFTYASPSYQKIVGYSPETLIGKKLTDFLHPEESDLIQDMIAEANQVNMYRTYIDFQLKDSEDNWKIFSGCISSFSNSGRKSVVALNCHEITERVQNEKELASAYEATLVGWSRALELRSKEIEGHSQRVTEMTLKLATAMGMDDDELVHVRRGTLLHDIGKMAIPDEILLKEGELTDEEWEIMEQHPSFAHDMLYPIEYLRPALDIPCCHHEKWNGSGYPNQLKGEEIPLAARVFMVIDVWDALTSERPYREAWSHEKARAYIRDQSGKYFDPDCVKTFLEIF
jgi:PAS domain S-box-containing protein